MALNQSRVKMFRRCQKQYSFRYDTAGQLGLDPMKEMIPKRPKVQLRRGTWLHELLMAHHQSWSGLVSEDAWKEQHLIFKKQYDALFEEEKEDLGDLPGDCLRLFQGYLRFWGQVEQQYRVAEYNGEPAIEFVVEQDLSKWGIEQPFKGRIDLLVEDLEYGGEWIWDHKWVKSVPDNDERMMSPQSPLYVWALRREGRNVRGFVNNYGRTKAPTVPRVLKAGTLSVAKRMDTDYYTYLRAIKELHGDMWKEYAKTVYRAKLLELRERQVLWYRRERFPIEKHKVDQALREFIVSARDIARRNTKYPPRSYFYNCKFGCEYHGICVAQFAGLDIEPLIKGDYTFEDERYNEPEPDLMSD